MPSRALSVVCLLSALLISSLYTVPAHADVSPTTSYSFFRGNDGFDRVAGVVEDASGSFYGVTYDRAG